MNDATGTTIAAILNQGPADVDALLASLVERQRRAGWRVRGMLMQPCGQDAACMAPMVLVDIHSGREYLVSQALGTGSNACRADTQAFARATNVLRDAIAQPPDLIVMNRFGSLEAEGGGFATELLELLSLGVPLLTAVSPKNVAAWTRFTGGAPLLPAQAPAVQAWLDGLGIPATPAA